MEIRRKETASAMRAKTADSCSPRWWKVWSCQIGFSLICSFSSVELHFGHAIFKVAMSDCIGECGCVESIVTVTGAYLVDAKRREACNVGRLTRVERWYCSGLRCREGSCDSSRAMNEIATTRQSAACSVVV